jgi:hypothetical protein
MDDQPQNNQTDCNPDMDQPKALQDNMRLIEGVTDLCDVVIRVHFFIVRFQFLRKKRENHSIDRKRYHQIKLPDNIKEIGRQSAIRIVSQRAQVVHCIEQHRTVAHERRQFIIRSVSYHYVHQPISDSLDQKSISLGKNNLPATWMDREIHPLQIFMEQ